MSQVHYDAVALEDLVSRAEIIFVGRKCTPFTSTVEIPILKPGEVPGEYGAPPFQRHFYHFEVAEVIAGQGLEVGAQVKVDNANDSQQFKIHRDYYLIGLSRSPIYRAYTAKHAGTYEAPECIVFAHRNGSRLVLAAMGAFEGVAERDRVQTLVKKQQADDKKHHVVRGGGMSMHVEPRELTLKELVAEADAALLVVFAKPAGRQLELTPEALGLTAPPTGVELATYVLSVDVQQVLFARKGRFVAGDRLTLYESQWRERLLYQIRQQQDDFDFTPYAEVTYSASGKLPAELGPGKECLVFVRVTGDGIEQAADQALEGKALEAQVRSLAR